MPLREPRFDLESLIGGTKHSAERGPHLQEYWRCLDANGITHPLGMERAYR
jgi:hypothetical protein